MAVSLNSVAGLNSVLRSSTQSSNSRSTHISSPYVLIKSRLHIKSKKRLSRLFVAENDRLITDPVETSKNLEPVLPSQIASPTPSDLKTSFPNEPNTTGEQEDTTPPKKVKLTARERLRAARVLSRDSDQSKPPKSQMGRSVLDALRESEKGKKGLPEAPANLLDDSKRGMPKKGLTFDFPGGLDLFLIAFSFVFISTVMFATTYIVWKVGAIHFNEN